MERTARPGRSALSSGALTALSTAVMTGTAAIGGAILAREFGHGVKTDGFFAAYGLYLALVLVAQTLRVVVLPPLTRAREEGRLAEEVGAWALALALVTAPLVAIGVLAPGPVARALAGGADARHAAADLIPWLAAGAAFQIFAGLLASALAALDDYVVAAAAFALGGIAGLAVIVAFLDHGVVVFGWGALVNGVVCVALPLVVATTRGATGRPRVAGVGRRLWWLAVGVALPFALQGIYVIANRFALGLSTGDATTLSYAYLVAAALVAVTASSIALISSVPLTREGLAPERAGRHIVAVSWLSLAGIALAAGIFGVAGAPVAERVLGDAYGGGTGAELGRLVVYLAPWMVASVGVSVAFPLLFVRGRTSWLPLLALAVLVLHVLVEWILRAVFGLAGVALGMAVTTVVVLAALTAVLGAVRRVARGLVVAAAVCGGLAALVFLVPRAVVGPVAAAAVGAAAYTAVLVAAGPPGLREAWAYVRRLH
ncbi:MAG TPA: hypothetical protein VK278_06055 [Gaiellaceae bacterium]|nr:hypothetical protein [Gaiellaceae bacterium]